ncbi:hypothetical protein ACLKA7_011037 [Drosophila subpalustris]
MSQVVNQAENCDDFELESQFIIRFPQDLANTVLESIEKGNIGEKLTIELDSELRHGKVRLNDELLHAKIVDLPTVVESYKTADNVSLYKTADISQMMVCSRESLKDSSKCQLKEPEKLPNSETESDKENDSTNLKSVKDVPKVDEKFLWPDGITPPTRNIRRRRLKTSIKQKKVDKPESSILKEVKYLLRMDSEAVRVDYEFVDDDGSN